MEAVRPATAPKIRVDYDRTSDVLYLALGKPVPAKTDEDDDGLAFRFALEDGRPCGVTIMGFRSSRWSQRRVALAKIIGVRLHVGNNVVAKALQSVHV